MTDSKTDESRAERAARVAAAAGMTATDGAGDADAPRSADVMAATDVLTAAQRVALARKPGRPGVAEFVHALFGDFFEQRGDRSQTDDPSIMGGIARFHGRPVTVIGNRKGSTIEERIACNFGMASPEGYRKAQRIMRAAEKFGRPIITFVDTSGAYPGLEAGVGAGGVHEGDDGPAELLGRAHDALGLAVALGARHAEVAGDALLDRGALAVADHRDGPAVEPGDAAHDARVVGLGPVAALLEEVAEQRVHELRDARAPRLARQGHALGRGEHVGRRHDVRGARGVGVTGPVGRRHAGRRGDAGGALGARLVGLAIGHGSHLPFHGARGRG